MGAWGHRPFENDDALEWAAELEGADDPSALAEAFDAIPGEADENVEAPEASIALAAGEVVAALLGRPTSPLPEGVKTWVAGQRGVNPGIVKRAQRAVKRVVKNSELRELWEESDDFPKWQAAADGLLK